MASPETLGIFAYVSTALMRICKEGDPDEIYLKITRANSDIPLSILVNCVDSEGNTPLIVAARHRNIKILKALIADGANVNSQAKLGSTALMWSCQSGDAFCVRYLLEHGADVSIRNSGGDSCIMWAAKEGNAVVLDVLWEFIQGNENARSLMTIGNKCRLTPLMCCAFSGNLTFITRLKEILLQLEVDFEKEINKKDLNGNTPLHFSLEQCQDGTMIQFLLENGASIMEENKKGISADKKLAILESLGCKGKLSEKNQDQLNILKKAKESLRSLNIVEPFNLEDLLEDELKKTPILTEKEEQVLDEVESNVTFSDTEKFNDEWQSSSKRIESDQNERLRILYPEADSLLLSVEHILGENLVDLSSSQLHEVENILRKSLSKVEMEKSERQERITLRLKQEILALEQEIHRLRREIYK